MLLHLVYNAGLEVALEDFTLVPLILDELVGIVAEVSVHLGHDDGGSTALILGGVTACAAQMMETRIETWHLKQTNSARLKVYSPIQAWTLYCLGAAVVYITM